MSLYYYIQDNLNRIDWYRLSENPKPLFIKWRQNIYKIILDCIFNKHKINKCFDATFHKVAFILKYKYFHSINFHFHLKINNSNKFYQDFVLKDV